MEGVKGGDKEIGKMGLWTAMTGAIIILIDGIAVLGTSNFYGLHYGGVQAVAWIEIILSILILVLLPLYKKSPSWIGWSIVILAIITLPFDGGFYTIGAWIALVGGVLIAYKK